MSQSRVRPSLYGRQAWTDRSIRPFYIGKTWFGKYDEHGQFTASDPNKLIARYFLDFNPGALEEQQQKHWDGSEEDLLDPIPEIDN